MPERQLYQLALTMIKGVGDVIARQLVQTVGSAEAIFTEKKRLLEKIPGIGSFLVAEIQRPEVLLQAEKELEFVRKNDIRMYYFWDEDYPLRLRECEDAPVLFYFKGTADLDAKRAISIVGTRNATEYGKNITENLVRELHASYPDLLVVSGLAYGIDICAHRTAVLQQMPTVGVLAHGLDRIYPFSHRSVAIEMLRNGGLLTDYPTGTNPDRPNFVRRNRIVAGLSDATVVVESSEKGGSLITADIAFSYGRDVFGFPGRIHDQHSCGCNTLIRQNKAALITSAADLIAALCWDEASQKKKDFPRQTTLLFDLNEEEQQIVNWLTKNKELQINQLSVVLNVPIYKLSSVLLEMEMKGILYNLPGGRYKLCEGYR